MNGSSPKRIKLDLSLPPPAEDNQNPKDVDDDLEEEHCTICLQSFLDRTIIPVCAHEFCFECILLWSEQSRKCPLCSRSFDDDSYLIHHIRSQYDYQKHYLPPRSSPRPPLMGESRATALRNARRERQWGRRQRQQREEADQLERAIARRRWIYQHRLYAKHVASNPYTRYRPFPTPSQFATSPDLISRMTMFLRRELRVWPNLDVEFLITYTISLMKSIDIRSESAVKLISEFLDLDTPYSAGARHVNAEHFAHEIYSYLRSPYRDLNMYDQSAQYDTPPEISPPREIERGNRWSAEPSPPRRSRSRSNSRRQSPVPRRENSARHSPTQRHGGDSSAEAPHENRRPGPNRSPRGREDHDFRNRSRNHSPPDGAEVISRNGHSDGASYSVPSGSAIHAESRNNDFPVRPPPGGGENENGQGTEEDVEEITATTDTIQLNEPRGDDSAALLAANEAGVTRFINGPFKEGTGDEVADYVDDLCSSSSANPQPSRKRSAGLKVRPRNRTLSESVQAYLSRPTAPWHPPKKRPVSRDEQPTRMLDAGRRPRFLTRLTDGPDGPALGKVPSPCKTTVERTSDGDPDDDAASEQQPPHGRRFQSCDVFSSNRDSAIGAERADGGDRTEDDGATRVTRVDGMISRAREVTVALPRASLVVGALVDGRPDVQTSGVDDSDPGDVGEDGLHVGGRTSGGDHTRGRTDVDTSLGTGPSTSIGGELKTKLRAVDTRVDLVAVGGDASGGAPSEVVAKSGTGTGTGCGSGPETTDASEAPDVDDVDVDALALERRLRARARVRVRLEALKGAGRSILVPVSSPGTDTGSGLERCASRDG